MKIAVAMKVNEAQKKVLEQAAPNAEFYYGKDLEKIKGAEVLIGNLPPAQMKELPDLKWIQLNSAGANNYCVPGILSEDVKLTNATGAYGPALAEHLLAMLLAMIKKLYLYQDDQKKHTWADEGTVTSLDGATVLIIGFGDIGRHFGRLCKAMGAHVIGMRRRSGDVPPEADEMGRMDELDAYLAKADVIASALPATPATTGLYTAEKFAAMKQGAYFLNIGRGDAVDQEALRQTLLDGHLAGAAIDVTSPEPLPADSPLWDTPNLYITPHVSGGQHLPATWDRVVKIAADNLKRYIAGEPLQNTVDRKTGYKK